MTERGVGVRPATTVDAPTVGRLLFDFNTEFDTPALSAQEFAERFSTLLGREDVLVLLAEAGGEAVGLAYLTLRPTPYGDGPILELEELYTAPAARGQGIGSAMIADILALGQERGAVEIRITVHEVDIEARRFYERHGFTNVDPDEGGRMLCYLRELDGGAPADAGG